MTKTDLLDAIAQLRKVGTDLTHIEAKLVRTELPKRIWETISAFSNTSDGGTLILGLAEDANFDVVGVTSAPRIQQALANVCSEMEPAVRAHIQVHHIQKESGRSSRDSRTSGSLQTLLSSRRRSYYGAFVRVADGDRKLSHYEVQMLLAARGQPRDDEDPVAASSIDDFQSRLTRGLLNRLRKRPGSPFAKLDDEAILRNVKALVPLRNQWVCSLGGLLALGKYPQQFFPALGVTFVVYPGTAVGEPGHNQERFLDNVRIDGPVPSMLEPTLAVIRRNMKNRSLVRGLYREDVEEYPITAVREAIINALAHRDLSNSSRRNSGASTDVPKPFSRIESWRPLRACHGRLARSRRNIIYSQQHTPALA
ncbi:MAG: putative DNA binding domain-containing protein [Acidobacteriota bacterium]|nr:putative DNA binding domain-containing protein [Acidobacteriota bacterium]